MAINLTALESHSRPALLNVTELAAFLKVKPRPIYEMVAQNRIPYRKPQGSNILRFDLDEIIAWTKAGNNKWRQILKVLLCGHSLWWLQPQGERMSVFKKKNKNGTTSYGYDFQDRVTGLAIERSFRPKTASDGAGCKSLKTNGGAEGDPH